MLTAKPFSQQSEAKQGTDPLVHIKRATEIKNCQTNHKLVFVLLQIYFTNSSHKHSFNLLTLVFPSLPSLVFFFLQFLSDTFIHLQKLSRNDNNINFSHSKLGGILVSHIKVLLKKFKVTAFLSVLLVPGIVFAGSL